MKDEKIKVWTPYIHNRDCHCEDCVKEHIEKASDEITDRMIEELKKQLKP